MLALIHAIQGKKVDIITSNPVLARRDKEDWEKLYKMFGVSCSVIPPPGLEECTNSLQREKAIKQAYKANIIYSTISNLAADTLRQEFEKTTTRGNRLFDMAIVDEVDYMALDSGVQVTYLSHAATGMRHLEPVLAAIWAKVCSCRQIEDAQTGERVWITGAQYFHKAAVTAVMGPETSEHFNPQDILMPGLELGFFTEEDIQKLASKVDQPKQMESQDSEIKELMDKLEPSEQRDLLAVFQAVLEDTVQLECYKVENGRAVRCDTNSTTSHDNKIRMLLLEHGLACIMMSEEDLITATVDQIKLQLKFSNDYIPPEKEEETNEHFLLLPGYLEEYANYKLRDFAENSLKAILMMNDREYMIESATNQRDDNVSKIQEYYGIIPVDFRATGILEKNKCWGDGLQQFLEMKHQLAISPLTNVTNYMSNFHFLQRYNGLFGVSGTLGDEAEIDFLRKYFKTSCLPIPTHRFTKRVELPPIQVEGERDDWIRAICECVKDRTKEKHWVKGQAVLVVCEDVRTADELHKRLLEYEAVSSSDKITMYTRSDKHNVEDKIFNSGDVIIATNLGGRGTDFKVTKEVNESGGLCVILTHFPKNRRTEKQIFGRTARKGNPGMVQMVLNQEDLAPNYQGQPVEIMRKLRADYERSCIADMEDKELKEVEMREKLFNMFCLFLNDFERNYSTVEKIDIFICTDKNLLATNFGCYKEKMDYRTALNALKESWALWLALQEKNFNDYANLDQLKNELEIVLREKKNELLKGNSNNFYDIVKLAMDRMYLHTVEKDNDYGALTYWEKSGEVDQVYRAVSLYNRAYITVNLRKNGYIEKAIAYLKDTKKSIDVLISEQTNTTVACQISSTAQFEPHCKDEPNLAKQMQIRMSLFKSWLDYIDKSVEKLEELQEAEEDAITKDTAVFSLSDRHDYIITEELNTLYEMGLSFVFEVEKKPQFCIDALICAILGALQILTGVLVCALSFGTATQFGMGLIMEGVTDLVTGAVCMMTGSFSWAEWAIGKSISFGLSLMTAGFSTISNLSKTVYQSTRSLLTGAKTFASLAEDAIQKGRVICTSVKQTVQSAISSTTRESLSQSMKALAGSTTVKTNFRQAARFSGQETAKLVAITALEFAVDEGLQAIFKSLFAKTLCEVIAGAIKANVTMNKYVTKFIIIHSVPNNVLAKMKQGGFAIVSANKKNMKDMVERVCRSAVAEVTNDFETFSSLMSQLKPLSEAAIEVMKEAKVKGFILQRAEFAQNLITNIGDLMQILNAIPTKDIIDNRVVPFMTTQIDTFPNATDYQEDERCEHEEVVKVHKELLQAIIDELCKEFTELLAVRLTAQVGKTANRVLGEHVSDKVSKIVGSQKTEQFFADQTHRQEMKKIKPGEETQKLSESEQKDFDDYVKKLQDENRPATELDLNILTKSNQLQGKGIRILMVDEKGNKLATETYPGSDSSAGNITLQLTKVREKTGSESLIDKVEARLKGEQSAYSGNFSLVQSDGTLVSINSKDPASLYSNLAAAIGSNNEADIQSKAQDLKNLVNKEISEKTDQYQELIKKQMDYEAIYETAGKYTIQGTATVSQDQSSGGQVGPRSRRRRDLGLQTASNPIDAKVEECLQKLSPVDLDLVLVNSLGLISATSSLPGGSSQFNVVPSSIPSTSVLELALRQASPEIRAILEEVEKKGLAVTVLSDHYWSALSNGWESTSAAIRSKIADELVNGNWEKAMKLSFISSHPLASENLREDAELESYASWRWDPDAMSEEGMNTYYQMGFYHIMNKFRELKVLEEDQLFSLLFWIEAEEHLSKETPEYQEILTSIKTSEE
uniref:Uncharacterized protein LOC117357011 n=1 Tax=Geotrypetes seraphini TaxID=260995 RepID=A0A6P8R2V5_GEOSA|nr:uncharacterized protein LOC117357011 [Geotrypetes seraphini]